MSVFIAVVALLPSNKVCFESHFSRLDRTNRDRKKKAMMESREGIDANGTAGWHAVDWGMIHQ